MKKITFLHSVHSFYLFLVVFSIPINIINLIVADSLGQIFSIDFITGYSVLTILYIAAMLLLGLSVIAYSFRAYYTKQTSDCVSWMMTLKLGVFYLQITYLILYLLIQIADWLLEPIMALILIFLLLFLSQEIAFELLMFVFVEPIYIILFLWLAMIPGAFYGVQVIRQCYVEGRMGKPAAVMHGILQFLFIADVIDASYLAVKAGYR